MKNNKIVMIPGPTPVVRSIMDQMGRETVSFKDPQFVKDFKELVSDLRLMWKSKECFILAGTGTLAMEVAAANSVKKGDNVLVISQGYFGDRFIDLFERRGVNVDVLSCEWGKAVDIVEIDKKLKEKQYNAVTVTHVDTSTGVCSDVAKIGNIISKYDNTIFIVDGVCSSAAEREYLDDMHIDILLTGSQKAFGVTPGLAIIWASKKAMNRREQLGTIMDSYMDFKKWLPIMHDPMNYYGTPPVNLIWALKESVRIINEEGLEERYERHIRDSKAIQASMEKIGFEILAEKNCRSVTLSNIIYPKGINDNEFRKILAEEGVIVAGGLGEYTGKLFRLGHMGNIDKHIIVSMISAIERTMIRLGYEFEHGIGVKTYLEMSM